MFSIFFAFFCIAETFVSGEFAKFEKLELPPGVKGTGGLTFGKLTPEGPFVTTLDGRIMKWNGTTTSFVDFAYTSPNRTKELCDGVDDPDMWKTCGRPFALAFDNVTNTFYIADAYRGLLAVSPRGGLAIQLLGGFKFVNGIDVMSDTIFFSDASLTYDVRDAIQPGFVPDASGRFLNYDPVLSLLTRRATVMLSGLRSGGGPAVSSDGTFVLISEVGNDRIRKFWLVWPKSGTSEVLIKVNGNPNAITRAAKEGEFWVATTRIGYVPPKATIIPEGVRFDSDGQVLERVQFGIEYPNLPISVVLENEGKLYVASHYTNFVGVYSN